MTNEKVKIKVEADTSELEDARDLIGEVHERLDSVVPNITIRNNDNVYVTINNYNTTAGEFHDREERR